MENYRDELISEIIRVETNIRYHRTYYNQLVDYQIDLSKDERKYRIRKIARFLRDWKTELKYYYREIAKIDSLS